jgi:AraC-like DNA-binding protein
MLRSVGLPLASLRDLDTRISVDAVCRLLEASAEASGIEDFGLRLAYMGGLTNLSPVALVVREQPTLGVAMETLARYVHIHTDAVRPRIERHDNLAIFAPVVLVSRRVPSHQATELVMGVLYRILKTLLGRGWVPLLVQFSHAPPRTLARHRRFFATTMTFRADFDGIVCPAAGLDRRLPAADAILAHYAQEYVKGLAARPSEMDEKVGELITALLPTGRCSIERVAQHLGCTRRTIHRHLAQCGTSFSDLLDRRRSEQVMKWLEDPGRPLTAIADLLGFSGQSALARWFRERHGCSISQWRKSHSAPSETSTRHPPRCFRAARRNDARRKSAAGPPSV